MAVPLWDLVEFTALWVFSSVHAAHFENMKKGGKEIMVLEISALSDGVSLLRDGVSEADFDWHLTSALLFQPSGVGNRLRKHQKGLIRTA